MAKDLRFSANYFPGTFAARAAISAIGFSLSYYGPRGAIRAGEANLDFGGLFFLFTTIPAVDPSENLCKRHLWKGQTCGCHHTRMEMLYPGRFGKVPPLRARYTECHLEGALH